MIHFNTSYLKENHNFRINPALPKYAQSFIIYEQALEKPNKYQDLDSNHHVAAALDKGFYNSSHNSINKYIYSNSSHCLFTRYYTTEYNKKELFHKSTVPLKIIDRLETKTSKLKELRNYLDSNQATLQQNEIKRITKEINESAESVDYFASLKDKLNERMELNEMYSMETDAESKSMIGEDIVNLNQQVEQLEKSLLFSLLPSNKDDNGNAILEIRAGTGGSEAQLFALDIFNMYRGYAENKGWEFDPMDMSYTEVGGCRDASASISGRGVFGFLKYESGVHRVQRVPDTETQGRVHTSTITVAILPEPKEVDINIKDNDLRIDVYRSSGNGGQSVNTTDSAVRITHIPTGTVVCMQDERSQIQNRTKAMKVLRARLYEAERVRLQTERDTDRNSQIGSAARSERIRTYNYPQDRVTDHRVNVTSKTLHTIITGEDLDTFIEEILVNFQTKELEELKNQ
ncbi:hypothetical protein CYY_005758 [Polysphondylium violaceum]|uniref:Prokaryotic-type class I peptide chain release factors domain-containing protein n=1 Tax=Polysphondylium violaceum TaxID=133409 RepID=A0A8J4PTB3_9MYCE|nr:hypothetical protein CYY_005758 [Polysphondylium violaceum]